MPVTLSPTSPTTEHPAPPTPPPPPQLTAHHPPTIPPCTMHEVLERADASWNEHNTHTVICICYYSRVPSELSTQRCEFAIRPVWRLHT
eukprot:scaffold5935_cov137-Isochrysis_galbana.AAC.7